MPALLRSPLLRHALTVAALLCAGFAALALLDRWQQTEFAVDWGRALLSLPLALLATLLQTVAWALLLRTMVNSPPGMLTLLAAHARSSLGRYAPGKVGQPVLRIAALAPHGVSTMTVTASMVLELLSWTATACAVASALFAWAPRPEHETQGLSVYAGQIAGLLVLGAIGLASIDRRRYVALTRRAGIPAEGTGPLLPWSVLCTHAVSWIAWAAQGVACTAALGAETEVALRGAVFFVLAPVAGFLALPVPAGIGVRESVIALGLASALGPSAALGAALVARAGALSSELLLWAVLERLNRRRVVDESEAAGRR
jgi:glycosyltransferase 2 family protein